MVYVQATSSVYTSESNLKRAEQGFSPSFRHAVREVRTFLPEAGYTSQKVAMLVHLTSSNNYICRYHQNHRGHHKSDNLLSFQGVAYQKAIFRKKSDNRPPNKDHMHCGCFINDVLLEFLFWKTVSTQSTHHRQKETVHYMDDILTPCNIRAFWVSHFKTTTGLTLDDLYGMDLNMVGYQASVIAKLIVKNVVAFRVVHGIGMSLKFNSRSEEQKFEELGGSCL